MNVIQQLSISLDEPVNNQALEAILQALDEDRNLRDLYSRYLLIGAAMRGESINPIALHVSEQVRSRLTLLPTTTKYHYKHSIRWFNYINSWNITIAIAMSIIIAIGWRMWLFDVQQQQPVPTLSFNRHFWPGVITLNTHQPLSRYATTQVLAYPPVSSIIAQLQVNDDNDILTMKTKAIHNYNLHSHAIAPAQYLDNSYYKYNYLPSSILP